MTNQKHKRTKRRKKHKRDPKNGFWSRMIHKWWLRYYDEEKKFKKGLKND